MSFTPSKTKNERFATALVDCNNFFVSCEQIFNPRLKNKPVVVLSNNDGCIVSRSAQAKALQIPMAAPYFEYKSYFEAHGGIALSSNFELYGDISQRVMQSLQSFGYKTEIYSIDEAFIQIPLPLEKLEFLAYSIRKSLLKWTGITVSIGVAPSKVLAKVANRQAKKSEQGLWIANMNALNSLLPTLPVDELWGISRSLGSKLRALGIQSAKQLQEADPFQLRKATSVAVEKILWELRGINCLELETVSAKKTILCSRSFAKPVQDLKDLEEALSSYVQRASEKLRAQQLRAQGLCVFLRTSYYQSKENTYSHSINRALTATNNTSKLIQEALSILKTLYKEGYNYQKVGVLFWNLTPTHNEPLDCFQSVDFSKSDRLMQTLDHINQCMGKNSLFYASQGLKQKWSTRSSNRSARYTTCWNELPLAF